MMGGVNMKKYTIKFLVCFLSFFLFIGTKNAKNISFDASVSVGNTASYSLKEYKVSNCGSSANGYVSLTPTSGGSIVKITTIGTPSANATDTVVCSYTTSGSMGAPETGNVTFNIVVSAAANKVINLGMTSTDYQPTKNIATEVLPSDATITGYEVAERGAEYITVGNCSGTTCNVSISDEANNLASDGASVSSAMKLTYKLAGSDNEYVINVTLAINTASGARAYHGGAGTCSFSSDWTYRTWTDSGNKTYKFYQSRSSNATLPNCDSSNSKIPIEFKGWKETASSDHVYAIGECSGALPAGSSAVDGKNYSSCYERAPYVQISPATGDVDVSTGWQALKGNSGYYYTSTSASSVTLPELLFKGVHKNDEVDYWYKSDDPSVHKNSGDSVDLDGSIWIAVVKTVVSEGWKDLYKTVNTDQTVALVVSGMTGCSVSSTEYVTVNYTNGECLVSGVKETPDEVFADVNVAVDGQDVTYKFNVVKVDDANIIVDDSLKTNLGTNSEITNKQEFYSTMCTSFTITGGNGSTPYTKNANNPMNGTIYNVTEACGQSGNQGYYAFCLDPGRQAPSSTTYERLKDTTGAGSGFKKIVEAYLSVEKENAFDGFEVLDNPKRIAFHIAIRAVAIQHGVSSSADTVYYNHYLWYQDIAKSLDDGSWESKVNGLNLVDGVAENLIKYFAAYTSQTDDIEEEEFERTVESTKTEAYGDQGYKMTYVGTIIAPTGISIESLNSSPCTNSGRGVTCNVEKFEEASSIGERKVYNYIVTITAADAGAVNPPETEEDKMKSGFKIDYRGGLALADYAIVGPTTYDEVQRMFVFNTEPSDVYVYFSIVPTTCDLPALDYKSHCDADGCDSTFNADLFKASGCCRLVTDETKYKYIIDNYCSGDGCTVSTMSSVCGLNSSDLGSAELYEIKEGATYENGSYQDKIGQCLVNVNEYKGTGLTTELRTDSSSGYNSDGFKVQDSVGNSLNVASYSTNKYCQVSCGEDWQISLESFGNFVGKNAVGAGSYFSTTNADIFIGGTRTCYTTYINPDTYMKDLVAQSERAINAYNLFSEASHIWTDTEKQSGSTLDEPVTYNVCIESKSLSDVWSGSYVSYSYNPGSLTEDPSYTISYSATCPNRNTDGTTTYVPCEKEETKTACKTRGSFVEYKMVPKGVDSDGLYYDFYTNNVSANGTSNSVTPTRKKYDNTETFTCADGYTPPSEDGTAEITCELSGYDGKSGLETICNSDGKYGFCKENDTGDKDKAYESMKEVVQTKAAGIMDEQSAEASDAVNLIHNYSQQMYNCQHFELYNTTDDNRTVTDYAGNTVEFAQNEISKGEYLDHTNVSYVTIETQFNPHVAYEYDEPEFMTILGSDNVLVEYIEKNDAVWGGVGSYAAATNDSKEADFDVYESRNNTTKVDSSKVLLSRNDIETTYYQSSSVWTGSMVDTYGGDGGDTNPDTDEKDLVFCQVNSTEGYSPSMNPYEWTDNGNCYTMKITYLKANYIKSSISNSSFYRNKGFWYLNANDLKEHGDNLQQALENANKRSSNTYNVSQEISSGRWYPFGNDQRELVGGNGANVFPVSLDTPRNLYLYSYEFGDIGTYTDGKKIGRLMGDETSVIKLNTRTCFYEVYEELCLCCGSSITSYVENSDSVNDYRNSHSEVKFEPSDPDAMIVNDNGVISFATSSVSLSDLNSDSGRILGNNWGESQFLYSGELYKTWKGEKLLEAIESQGENVYADQPEYSYYLTPSTISAIRDYNDQYGYEVNYNNLKVYGSYAIKPICDSLSDSSCWEFDMLNNNYIIFQHYGSTFLEDFMTKQGAVYSGTLTEKSINTSCYVTADDANSYEKIKSKVDSGCRWVDYIENKDGNYFRLAYK